MNQIFDKFGEFEKYDRDMRAKSTVASASNEMLSAQQAELSAVVSSVGAVASSMRAECG